MPAYRQAHGGFAFIFEKCDSGAIKFFFKKKNNEKQFLKGKSVRNFLKILSWHSTGIAS